MKAFVGECRTTGRRLLSPKMEKGLVPFSQVALASRDVPHLDLGQTVLI